MARPQLRIYCGPAESTATTELHSRPAASGRVSVPLQEIFPVLADAVKSDRTWLRDFADDEVVISTDLYEVILAYQHYRRPSA